MEDSSKIPSLSSSFDRPKSARQLRFNVPSQSFSSKNLQNDEILRLKKIFYNPFNEIACYQQYQQRKQEQKIPLQNNQQSLTNRIDSIQEFLPGSLLIPNCDNLGNPSTERQIKQQMAFTDRKNRQSSLMLNFKQSEKPTNTKIQTDSRKSSIMIEDFQSLNNAKSGSLNIQAISAILPIQKSDSNIKNQNNINRNQTNQQIRRNSSALINPFFEEKKNNIFQDEKQTNAKTQRQEQIQNSKILSQGDLAQKQHGEDSEFTQMVKRKANQETQSYKEIQDLTKFLKKQRRQTTRFLKKTKKNQIEIEQELKDVDGINYQNNQERQQLQYIIREQLNSQRDRDEIKKMLSETLRSKQIKNFMNKLKVEKSSQCASKIISKIKTFKGDINQSDNKFFTDMVKDPNALAKPLSVLVEYAFMENNIDQLKQQTNLTPQEAKAYFKKRKQQQLSLKDNLEIDFFKHINPADINRSRADTFYEIRSQAMSISQQSLSKGLQINTKRQSVITGFAKLIESLLPQTQKQTKLSAFSSKKNSDNLETQDEAALKTDRLYQLDQIIQNRRHESEDITQSSVISEKTNHKTFKRKPLLNGGIEYEYVNDLGFKVRVQKPPKKKEYKEVQIQKVQRQEDVQFDKFVKQANKIANEVEYTNRITDFSHKAQFQNYKHK